MEHFVHRLLTELSIKEPEQLSINAISELTNTPVKYWELSSEAVSYKGKSIIFINETLSEQAQWQELGHEFYHTLGHAGSQSKIMNLSFYQLQEKQANYFAYHFCVPTFMLDNLKEVTAYEIMILFNVDEDFAFKRLEMYKNRRMSIPWRKRIKREKVTLARGLTGNGN